MIAEKFEAMVQLGIDNTRMKDFYDLLIISRTFILEGYNLQTAIRQTFTQRGTNIPVASPLALTEEFACNPNKTKQWKQFLNRNGLSAGSLSETVTQLRAFLLPLLLKDATPKRWQPGLGWTTSIG